MRSAEEVRRLWETRKQAVKLRQTGLAASAVAAELGTAARSVRHWYQLFRENGWRGIGPTRAAREESGPAPAEARVAQWLEAAVRKYGSLYIGLDRHPEEDDHYTVRAIGPKGANAGQSRKSLADAIRAVAGAEPKKACPGCAREKPVGLFARNASNPDGINRRCLECERERARERKRRATPPA